MLRLSFLFGIFLSFSPFTVASSQVDRIVIPFRTIGKTIVIQGSVDGQVGNLIIDTGIPRMVLNKRYAESARLFSPKEIEGFQSANGSVQNNGMSLVFLDIQAYSARIAADVLDLKPIERQKRMNILGIVGLNLFRKYEFEIDFFSKEIRLYRLGRKGTRRILAPQALPSQTLSFQFEDHLPIITANLNGEALQLGLDTGAEMNLISAKFFEGSSHQFKNVQTKILMDLTGERITTLSAQMAGLQVGTLDLPAMHAIFIPLNTRYGGIGSKNLDGLLGYEFFQHFRVAINFKKRQVYLWDAKAIENMQEVDVAKNE